MARQRTPVVPGGPGRCHPTVSPLPRIHRMQETHHVLHHMLVIHDRLLQPDQLLDQHGVMQVHFLVALLEMRQLLLCRHELRVHQVHLLGGQGLVGDLRRFPGRRRLATNVIQRILTVRFELGVLELPRLGRSVLPPAPDGDASPLTPRPYGDCPLSSLLWRTLWKSYLFSWRTKLAKLLCLKCLGRMDLVNLSFCGTHQTAGPGRRLPRAAGAHLQHHKAVPFISPPHDGRIGGVLQHPSALLAWLDPLRSPRSIRAGGAILVQFADLRSMSILGAEGRRAHLQSR